MPTGFLEEQPGVKSSTRLIMLIGTVWALVMATVLLLILRLPSMDVAGFVSAVVVVFGGIKVASGAVIERNNTQQQP
jgi:uncharacterized membrane protein